jgi:hypothetical protein
MKAPKFEVSLADRQRQKREAVAKIQGKKAYRVYDRHEDDLPVRNVVNGNIGTIIDRYFSMWPTYQVKLLHPKEAMLLKLQGYDIEEV